MTNLYSIDKKDWQQALSPENQKNAARQLESGHVLYFPELAFSLLQTEEAFIQHDITGMQSKNVSFNPATGALKGILCSAINEAMLKHLSERYYSTEF